MSVQIYSRVLRAASFPAHGCGVPPVPCWGTAVLDTPLRAADLLILLSPRAANFELTATPSTKEAQAIADELYAGFVSEVRALDTGLGLLHLRRAGSMQQCPQCGLMSLAVCI